MSTNNVFIRNIRFVLVFALMTTLALTGCSKKKAAPPTPQQALAAYISATEAKDGKAAVNAVSASTIEMYERCRKAAVKKGQKHLEKLNQAEVILCLRLRYKFSAAQLNEMDGQSTFIRCIERGLIKTDQLAGLEISDIRITGDTAIVKGSKEGLKLPGFYLKFVREEGSWKLDLDEAGRYSSRVLDAVRTAIKKSKVALAYSYMQEEYGRVSPAVIREPLR